MITFVFFYVYYLCNVLFRSLTYLCTYLPEGTYYLMYYRYQAFSQSYDLALPPIPLASCLSISLPFCLCVAVELTDGAGGLEGSGKGPNHTTARKFGPL